MNDNQRLIQNALSLRVPQKDSLNLLVQVCEKLSLQKDENLAQALEEIKKIEPKIADFERAFPSVCFSIATGVGKTRLMGAFIAYLYLEKGIRHFFVLAPNLTIYNKLIKDFTPNTPKYVFPGIPDFAINPPKIITGETYHQVGDLLNRSNDDKVCINIFNISKINSDKDSRGTPRIRSFAEYLGQSYFDYLAGLNDLVIVMDEAHRYRASAGMAAINELSPVLGLELTATPKSTGAKGARFKNIIYDYPLAKAIHDGYVKKPAIVGRSDFKTYLSSYSEQDIEDIKIKDGIKTHEAVKAELEVYADNYKKRKVKPFILLIAKNIEHAQALKDKIESQYEAYKGKVIVVHSKQSGEEKDENIERLLAVESSDEPTEIVIHVDMLKEGWDVNNLYTIIPLKTADSKILVEQSIGRGLRLPYGTVTDNETVDRLHIIAHDKFNEIVDAAEKGQFEFQKIELSDENDALSKKATDNASELDKRLEKIKEDIAKTAPMLALKSDRTVQETSEAILEAIEDLGKVLSNSKEILNPENQARLVEQVQNIINEKHSDELVLEPVSKQAVQTIVQAVSKNYVDLTIDIPRVKIDYRCKSDIGFTFADFDLDLTPFNDLKPVPQHLIMRDLITQTTEQKQEAEFQDTYKIIEQYLLSPLVEYDDINYMTMKDLLVKLVRQVISHIKSYAPNELEVRKILFYHAKNIALIIHQQMQPHLVLPEMETVVKIDAQFMSLRTYKILESAHYPPVSFRNQVKEKSAIRQMVFEGFKKCLFAKQKFDSDTERCLSVILEDEPRVIKWFKISDERAKEVFGIKYEDPSTGKLYAYCPDFVVETNDAKYIIETKAADQITNDAVQAKTLVAKNWCEHATAFEQRHDGKEWEYLLVPHDTFVADRSFAKIIEDFRVK